MHSTPILNVTVTNTSTPPFFKVKDTLKFSITQWVMLWARKVIEILSSVSKFLSLFSIRKDIRNSLSKCIHFQFFYFSFFMNQDHTKFYFTDLSKKKKEKTGFGLNYLSELFCHAFFISWNAVLIFIHSLFLVSLCVFLSFSNSLGWLPVFIFPLCVVFSP